MELLDALKTRRSHRSYHKDKPVPRETILELIAAARLAPSSCNLQLTQYVVIDDQALLDELAKSVSYKFEYAPACIVVIYDPRITVEHHSAVMTAGMEVENLLLRATELGLGACPLAGFSHDRKIKRRLGIPDHLELLLLISVGYPDRQPSYEMPKIPLASTVSFNSFGTLETLNVSPRLKDHSIRSVIAYRSRIAAVYLDRFRLRTYSDSYYRDVVDAFAAVQRPSGTILDLMSYDGEFARLLRTRLPGEKLVVSDYLPHTLSFLSRSLAAESVRITDKNTLDTSETFACVTFVFQAAFTPELDTLVRDTARVIKSGGVLFVAWVQETRPRRFFKALRTWLQSWQKPANIYEGSSFYRIGPYEARDLRDIDSGIPSTYFTRTHQGVVGRYPAKGVTVRYACYKRS
jgi:nitroreductase/ubiquinone/menaquinone biosynthesis C-methylase UbiE